jgi:import inner membrane translocase subunit TIM21
MGTTYKPIEAIHLLRPIFRTARIPHPSRTTKAAFTTTRATTSNSNPDPNTPPSPSGLQRRKVTITNDTGAIRWSDLSPLEKAARTTQQSFNFALIAVGVALTGAVSYFLFTDVLSPSSKTAHFNRAVSRIRASPQITALLGPAGEISAHGEASWSRWARNRFITSESETDRWGTEHVRMRFYVEGPKGMGTVHVHLTKRPSRDEWEYRLLAVDVKGHQRVVLESAEEKEGRKAAPKIFGARWW